MCQTLLELPPARSTNDLDLFLGTEIIATHSLEMKQALDRAGFEVLEDFEYWRFTKDYSLFGQTQPVIIDLLTPKPSQSDIEAKRIRTDRSIRVKPPHKGSRVHAHSTEEAFAIMDSPFEVEISGQRENGEQYAATVFLPHPFSSLLMKLVAFEDRQFARNDPPQARKHASDLFTIVAMMTPGEDESTRQIALKYGNEGIVRRAASVWRDNFAGRSAQGTILVREQMGFASEEQIAVFLDVMADVFRDVPSQEAEPPAR